MVLSPAGMFSVRKFLLFVTTLVVTVFAYLFVSAPTAHAAEGKWKEGNIVYEGNTYEPGMEITKDMPGMPKGSKIFVYTSPEEVVKPKPKVHIIIFGKDDDPQTAKTATYAVYTKENDETFANPTNKTTVTFGETGAAGEDSTTSCVVEGIGWVVCPVSTFLSGAMDELFKILKAFLVVSPLQTDQENPLYRGWSIMRNFANVMFIIAFLIIIYSQITSIGLSSYGIKRLLPRIIIAAILVNISYWICAVLVDLSNIAGSSTYSILENIRNDLVGPNDEATNITWTDVSGAVLSAGAAGAGGAVAIYAAAASAGGAIYLLLPILVGILLAALVAILILAARQAIITILIFIAPLAFVAYLLPNTEKLFNKWKDLFVTMLMLFPLFAGVIGGAQLAGEAIIQNALTMPNSSPNKLNLIIFGMAIKVAPVVVTPFLLKFSGSLLGKIAGVVNNPGKGLVDRTRNWSQGKADEHKAKAIANTKNPNFLARTAQGIDSRKRKKEGWKKANEARADANWANSDTYKKIHGYDANSSQIKEIGENAANEHVAQMRATNAAVQGLDIRARASKLNVDVSQAKVEANWEAVKAGHAGDLAVMTATSVPPANVVDAINRSPDASRDLALAAMRKQAAERVQTLERGNQLMSNTAMIDGQTLQDFAGGVDPSGAQRALADALSKQHAARGEAVKNANSVIEHNNATDDQIVELAKGNVPTGINIAMTADVREAALKRIASGKNVKAIVSMLDDLDINSLNENQQIALGEELKANGAKPKYVTATISAKIAQGNQPLGPAGVNEMIKSSIEAGKYSAEVLATQDDAALERVLKAVRTNAGSYTQAAKDKLREQITLAKNDDILKAKLGERESTLDDILGQL